MNGKMPDRYRKTPNSHQWFRKELLTAVAGVTKKPMRVINNDEA
jgi:hypothetical protein